MVGTTTDMPRWEVWADNVKIASSSMEHFDYDKYFDGTLFSAVKSFSLPS